MALVKCRECGKEISDKADICVHCGCPVSGDITCRECGEKLKQDDKQCPNCGCPVGSKLEKDDGNKKVKKCEKCSTKLSDDAEFCPNCGQAVNNESQKNDSKPTKAKLSISNKVIYITLLVVVLFGIVIVCLGNNSDKLVCTYHTSGSAGEIKYKITYEFKNDRMKYLKGYQYAHPTDRTVAENLWKVTNNSQSVLNSYEGFTFNASYSRTYEVEMEYVLDIDKAPHLFKSVINLAGVSGITTSSSKQYIKSVYEKNNYYCN